MDGNIIDIKRFTIHDGYGIRSTVFLKGCGLHCAWCHNPEGIEDALDLWYLSRQCIHCHNCLETCPEHALLVDDDGDPSIWIDRQRCTKCGRCVEICPTTALSFDGQRLSSEAVVDILLRDKQFYQQSGGGITISGGDPLIQHHFAAEILRQCRAAGVHTAVETCLQGSWNTIKTFLPITDLFIVDLKLADNTLHQKYTGHSNRLIQENYRRLASIGCDMLTRIPLIPRITARPGNIQDIAQFIRECNPNGRVELINFNPLAKGKYRLMSRNQGFFQHMEPLKVDELAILHAILEAEGLVAIREN